MVSLCSLIRSIGVCAVRDQPELLCSRSDSRYLVHVATAGGCQRLLTHYRRREVRNSIYRYRKIYIDYRSKFSYRFISSILIIYGNTTVNGLVSWVENKRATALSQVKLIRGLIWFEYWNKKRMKQNLRNISDTLVQTEFPNNQICIFRKARPSWSCK